MITLLISLPLALADASPPPPPIVNGEVTANYVQVGAIMAYDDTYGGFSFCSGTLVHEKWVVSAAHCLEAASEYASYGTDIYFVLGEDLSQNGILDYDLAVNWMIHPEYDPNYLQHDIGVMELSEGFPDIEPIPLNETIPSEDWNGVTFDYVGWGVTGDGREDSGVKRYATIPFYDYDEQFIYAYDPDTNLCSGDSGGAGLLPLEDGGFTIAGVNSFVFGVQSNSTSCIGGGSGATRIDINFDWIREYVPEPPPPIVEEPEEELDGEDSESKEGLFAGCSTISSRSPMLLSLSVGLLLWGRREDDFNTKH